MIIELGVQPAQFLFMFADILLAKPIRPDLARFFSKAR